MHLRQILRMITILVAEESAAFMALRWSWFNPKTRIERCCRSPIARCYFFADAS